MPSRRIMVLLAITALALMTVDVRGFGPFQSVRGVTLTVTRPVRDLIGWSVSPIADTWQGAVHYDDLRTENDELRRQIAELEGEIDQIPDIETELQQLRDATNIDFIGDIPTITAQVRSDRQTSLERVLEIDRGSDDGIRVGMPVVVGDGLIGRVELVTGDRSEILLITDPRIKVGVISKGTRALGVAAGDNSGANFLSLDLEEGAAAVVEEGARFETSGVDRSIYPGGIPVGELTIVDEALTLTPFADLDRVAYVTIILVPEVE